MQPRAAQRAQPAKKGTRRKEESSPRSGQRWTNPSTHARHRRLRESECVPHTQPRSIPWCGEKQQPPPNQLSQFRHNTKRLPPTMPHTHPTLTLPIGPTAPLLRLSPKDAHSQPPPPLYFLPPTKPQKRSLSSHTRNPPHRATCCKLISRLGGFYDQPLSTRAVEQGCNLLISPL